MRQPTGRPGPSETVAVFDFFALNRRLEDPADPRGRIVMLPFAVERVETNARTCVTPLRGSAPSFAKETVAFRPAGILTEEAAGAGSMLWYDRPARALGVGEFPAAEAPGCGRLVAFAVVGSAGTTAMAAALRAAAK
jgi:hypothetical protein